MPVLCPESDSLAAVVGASVVLDGSLVSPVDVAGSVVCATPAGVSVIDVAGGVTTLDAAGSGLVDDDVRAVVADPDGPIGARFRRVALRAAGELAASGKDYSRLFPKITVEDA